MSDGEPPINDPPLQGGPNDRYQRYRDDIEYARLNARRAVHDRYSQYQDDIERAGDARLEPTDQGALDTKTSRRSILRRCWSSIFAATVKAIRWFCIALLRSLIKALRLLFRLLRSCSEVLVKSLYKALRWCFTTRNGALLLISLLLVSCVVFFILKATGFISIEAWIPVFDSLPVLRGDWPTSTSD
jgi:hypothetical protein